MASADKILSLYEKDLHVIVRGKAGAEVERVARQRPPKRRGAHPAQQPELQFGDTRLLEQSLTRIEALRIGPVPGSAPTAALPAAPTAA